MAELNESFYILSRSGLRSRGVGLNRVRLGYTVVEILVAIGIVSLLLLLLVPAVQSARNTAKTTECKNKLHQLGLAMQMEIELRGVVPAKHLEWLQRMQEHLGKKASAFGVADSNFVCPSERQSPWNSYRVSFGSKFWCSDSVGSTETHRKLTEITDGLSNTAYMSERLTLPLFVEGYSEDQVRADSRRFAWYTPYSRGLPGQEDEFFRLCDTERVSQYPVTNSMVAEYNHFFPPNTPACFNGSLEDLAIIETTASMPASSLHAGGVNVLFCDGHVGFVADGIDRLVWRALGSRNGAETVTESNF